MYRHARTLPPRLSVPTASRLALRRYAIDSPASRGPTAPGIPPVPPPTAHAKPVPAVVVPVAKKPDVIVPEAATAAATVVKPVPVPVNPINPKAGSAPPPPPPPPPNAKPPSKFFRKLFLYLALGTLVFYPTSAYVSLKSDKYRDFFTSTFPLAEQLIEYADDNDWDQLGAAKPKPTTTTTTGAATSARDAAAKAQDGARDLLATAQHKAADLGHKIAAKADTLTQQASRAVDDVKHEAARKVDEAKRAAGVAVKDVERETKRDAAVVERKAARASDAATGEAKRAVDGLKAATAGATQTAGHAVDSVKEKAIQAVDEVKALHFSDGVTELVDRAEQALGRAGARAERAAHDAEQKVEDVAHDLKAKSQAPVPAGVQAQMVDTQPKRDVVADGSHKVTKQAYTGPALPIGFEPPPGYYVPKPAATGAEPTTQSTTREELAADPLQAGLPEPKPVLPLLAPKVHEFTAAQDEPIISQLASTIDSLASSLSATSHAAGSSSTTDAASPAAILTRAQDDLASLSGRLQALKDEERQKLEATAERKRAEFEEQLSAREREWTNKEGELVEGWKEEREKLVEGWRKVLDRELEGQRVGIEQRLREEVIAQGIELQRRWLRSIKAQVETERGGRLAKLDHLTTSFKQLEKITLDNSSALDANVSLHTLWSALRAVQAKAERGGVAFDDELRVLKTAAAAAQAGASADAEARSLIDSMIESIERSGAARAGVKSFPALASWFTTTVAPSIQSVSLVPAAEHEAGVLSHVASAALSKLLFRRQNGWVEGDDVGAVLARAEYLLGEKDLDGAARQVNQLRGWAGKVAGDWLREARRRLEVEQALGVIATEATLSSLLLV
ncbi:hypothetical protein NliqN6_1924 [Naganishia liquefaciens]|uniref:MICOS complex subunit MIC60 n=1 Tax=Naganishia liquefaciens TaxID=104408 RepID=A0A8H3TQU7_9TREE|nr:hypothetical protein NliqN6_1924 [Naganishia liquefaciens]